MEIKEINKDIAMEFVKSYHYSKIFPRITKYYLGAFEDNELISVATLGYGTQPKQTIQKIFYNHKNIIDTESYFELGRFCNRPDKNKDKKNTSMVLSKIVKWLKQNTNCLYFYSLADGIMGKPGYSYQASNFRYIGKFLTPVYLMSNGEKLHPRTTKELLKENAIFEDKEKLFWLTYKFMELKGISKIEGYMFRYIYPLNRTANKILNEYEEYKNLDYPKDKDLKFYKMLGNRKREEIEQPKFDMNVCEYNYQKY